MANCLILDDDSFLHDVVFDRPDAIVSIDRIIRKVDPSIGTNVFRESKIVIGFEIIRDVIWLRGTDHWIYVVNCQEEVGICFHQLINVSLRSARPIKQRTIDAS